MAQKLIIEVIGDTRSYEKAMGRSSKATKSLGTQIGTLHTKTKVGFGTLLKGAAVFTGLTVGVRGLSNALVGSVKASTDFQASLQKMIGLSGVAQSAIGGLRQDVLRLAPTVGKSPQELADALFFITSSGIDAAHAMDVLTVSAKASASGLGETQVVADAVTSVLNAYGQANISATQATDVLVATVREGKGEASDFAGVIGNVTAIAGELGVSFDQVGAALAGMTRLGTSAETASVQLQQVFSGLLKTSPKVDKAFASVHLSLDQTLLDIQKPNGFLPALQKIKDAFGTNTRAIRAAFPDIRAYRGVIALVGKQSAPIAGIFNRLAKSTGSLGSAFGAISKTQAQQFARLNASIQVFKITLGSALAPAILKVVGPLNKWLSVTKNQERVQKDIRETVKTVIKVFRDFIAVMTPIVQKLGDLVGAVGGAKNAIKLLIGAFLLFKGAQVIFALDTAIARVALIGTTAEASTAKIGTLQGALLRLATNPAFILPAAAAVILGGVIVASKSKKFNDTAKPIQAAALNRLPEDVSKRLITEMSKGQREALIPLLKQFNNSALVRFINALDSGSSRRGHGSGGGKGDLRTRGGSSTQTTTTTTAGGVSVGLTPSQIAAARKKAAAAATKAFETAIGLLNVQAAVATRTKSLQDDLAVQKQIEKVIRARLAVTKNDVDLQQQLVDIQNQQLETQKQITENKKAARTASIFKALGLTGTGEKPTPSSGALLHRATGLLGSIKGTVLDTKKNRSQLKKIISVLKKNFKTAGQEVRAAILQMLNDISGDKTTKTGPLTKTHGLNTKKLVEGLGLSPEAERELRGRLSHFNTAGRAIGGGNRTTAPGGSRVPGQRGPSEPSFVANVNVYIDGKKVSNTVTKQQQKDRRRNPPQKRGPHSGHR